MAIFTTLYKKKQLLKYLRGVKELIISNNSIYIINQATEKLHVNSKLLEQSIKAWNQEKGINTRTLNTINSLYSDILDLLEGRLLHLGLTNKINSTITQFTLKNIYNWKDKQVIESKNINIELNTLFNEVLHDNNDILQQPTTPTRGSTMPIKATKSVGGPITTGKGTPTVKKHKSKKVVKVKIKPITVFNTDFIKRTTPHTPK